MNYLRSIVMNWLTGRAGLTVGSVSGGEPTTFDSTVTKFDSTTLTFDSQ